MNNDYLMAGDSEELPEEKPLEPTEDPEDLSSDDDDDEDDDLPASEEENQ